MIDYSGYGAPPPFGIPEAAFTAVVLVLVVWSLVWKGLALWHAARRGEKVWYVVLLVLNTAGILEIVYLFAVAKIQKREIRASAE